VVSRSRAISFSRWRRRASRDWIQQPQGVGTEALFHPQFVRQPLVVDAGRGGRFGRIHGEVDAVHDGLQGGRDDAATAGTARHQPGPALLEHDGRRHGGQGPLVGRHGIGLAAHQAEGVGHARLGGEIVHLVVEQDAGAGGDDAAAEGQVEGGGGADHVALPVGHRVVGGLLALVGLGPAWADGGRGRGPLRVDAPGQFVGIGLGGESGHGHAGEVRVAQVFGPVGIGPLHGLGLQVQHPGAAGAVLGQGIPLEQVEDLHDVGAAGTGRRHGDDLVTPVVAAHRLALDDPVAGQIVSRDQPAVTPHLGGDAPAGLAPVEGRRPLVGDPFQGPGQIPLHQPLAGPQGPAAAEEHRPGRRPGTQALPLGLEHARQIVADDEALPGQADGRRQQRAQGQGSPAVAGMEQAGDTAGYAHRQVGVEGTARHHLAGGIQVHVAAGTTRRHLTEIEGHLAARGRLVHQHEAAAAQVAGTGIDHGQGKADGHRRIHRIAALLQDVHAHPAGQPMIGCHHALPGRDRMEDLLVQVVADRRSLAPGQQRHQQQEAEQAAEGGHAHASPSRWRRSATSASRLARRCSRTASRSVAGAVAGADSGAADAGSGSPPNRWA